MKATVNYIDNRLIITPSLCSTYGANSNLLYFLNKWYPDGFTSKDLLEGKIHHLSLDDVAWCYTSLPFKLEEKTDLLKYLNIESCCGHYMSHHLFCCDFISYSHYCENSSNVKKSEDVYNSDKVYYSSDITASNDIYKSSIICGSKVIVNSKKVDNSSYIFNSKQINNSIMVYDAATIEECVFIKNCEKISNCIFCEGLSNTSNRIFCSVDDPNAEYMILNREVSQRIFERCRKSLKDILNREYVITKNKSKDYVNIYPQILMWRNNLLKDDLYKEVYEALPHWADEERELLYSMTFVSELLKI